MKTKGIITTLVLMMTVLIVTVSCDKRTDEHAEEIDIEFSYLPNPAIVGTAIEFNFEPHLVDESHETTEEHEIEISMVTCETGLINGSGHSEMMVEKEAGHGAYEGTITFAEAGSYEVHFSYMYDEEMHEKEFSLEVIAN